LAHLAGEALVVVGDGHVLDEYLTAAGLDDRQPHVRAAVVGRASEDAGVDDAAAGLDEARPVQPRVGAHDEVGLEGAQQLPHEGDGGRALPQELVDLARRAVAAGTPTAADRQPDVTGTLARSTL